MPDGESGLVAQAPANSVSPSALADNETLSRIERNKSTILSAGDARFAGRDKLLQGPIASRLIGLAFPILIVLAVQTLVSVAEPQRGYRRRSRGVVHRCDPGGW